jgi:hypothetical protein
MMADVYEIAVGRDEAEELADRIAAALPEMALPGARCGVGITALMILMRRTAFLPLIVPGCGPLSPT